MSNTAFPRRDFLLGAATAAVGMTRHALGEDTLEKSATQGFALRHSKKNTHPLRTIIGASVLLASSITSATSLSAEGPAKNPWLNDSVYPISHHDPAQTDTSQVVGPSIGKALTFDDAQSVLAAWVSNPTIKTLVTRQGEREQIVIASNPHGILKLRATGEAFDIISKVAYPDHAELMSKVTDADIKNAMARVDQYRSTKNDFMLALSSLWTYIDLSLTPNTMGSGAYALVDKDGYHYTAYNKTSVVKSFDNNQLNQALAPVAHVDVRQLLPAKVAAQLDRILGINMTYDGHLIFAASGMMFVLNRELQLIDYQLFADELVENSIALDEQNGIYMVTSKNMHKLVWTGERLSRDPKDGAWSSAYDIAQTQRPGALSKGSGTTPSLMGFGESADKLVLISDHSAKGTNIVAFWRDEIPTDHKQKPGTQSARIADQHKISVSDATVEASFLTFDDGVVVVNTTYPEPAWINLDALGNAMLAGTTRAAPMGVEKFTWNKTENRFEQAWLRTDIDGSDWMPPSISPASGLVYLANRVEGRYEYVAADWETGDIAARWSFPDSSIRWGNWGGVTTFLEDGDLLVGGFFAFTRYNIGHLRKE